MTRDTLILFSRSIHLGVSSGLCPDHHIQDLELGILTSELLVRKITSLFELLLIRSR